MKTDTINSQQLNSSTADSLAWRQGALASDTDIREAGWAKNRFRKTPTPSQEIVSISDFSAQTDFNNITESVNDVIAISQSGNPSDDLTLDNLKSAMGNLKRGKVYSFFGINITSSNIDSCSFFCGLRYKINCDAVFLSFGSILLYV